MSNIINKKSELLFCYDVTDANPNGDPIDENKPRIDEETSINFVTDVRLKRTIRDYLFEYKGFNGKNKKDIFVREKESSKGGLQDGKARAKDFNEDAESVLNSCIDIRLFGGVLPLTNDSIKFTGPVQFKMGRSLHKVEIKHIQGTGAFAGKEGAKQRTFREEYVLPYSFIAFHGIVNQNAAQHSKMNEQDEDLLLEAMWMGTKNLISRSKFGQQPRFLLKVDYSAPNFFIGDLDKKVKILHDNELQLRSIKDFELNIDDLLASVREHSNKIAAVHYKMEQNLKLSQNIPDTWSEITEF